MVFISISLMLAFVFNLALPVDAYAYLDPNAGGFFLQVIIPLVFGAAAAITVYWKRLLGNIKSFISRMKGNNSNSREE